MKTSRRISSRRTGFTLVEVMISLGVFSIVMGMTLSTFLFGLRMMYKDSERLQTNTTLQYFMSQVAKKTLDASEFYIFPAYTTLDGNVDSEGDLTTATTDSYGIDLYHGDCLVLVTRTTLAEGSNIRQICIYYRTAAEPGEEGGIRYYEGTDYGISGTTDSLDELLDVINLDTEPNFPGSIKLADRCLGRPVNDGSGDRFPIFSSKAPTVSAANESLSINAEVINGTSVTNMLSSSSFNYTISPRR